MHLLSFVPLPGLAHLPTQFAALFSHSADSIPASAGELRSTPTKPMRVTAKKRCRAMFEPSEKCELRKIPEIFARYAALFLSRIHYLRQVAGALALAYARALPV